MRFPHFCLILHIVFILHFFLFYYCHSKYNSMSSFSMSFLLDDVNSVDFNYTYFLSVLTLLSHARRSTSVNGDTCIVT